MQTIKVASFNCEWMNKWFKSGSGSAAFVPTFKDNGHANQTDRTAQRLANVITTIDPDILAIEEAPSRPEELQLFIDTYLQEDGKAIYKFLMGDSGGAQKLAVLYKPSTVKAELAPHSSIKDLIDPWETDVDGNELLEMYEFTRLPLVVNVTIGAEQMQMIVLHTKSNFINQGRQLWEDPNTRQQFVHEALECRRRISTEAMRTRIYIDSVLQDNPMAKFLVLGDCNDGAGKDYFEENYLSHNVTDILIGSAFQPEQIFTHAQHDVPPNKRYTAEFEDFVPVPEEKQLLLDHILISPGLAKGAGLHYELGSGQVHHDEYNAEVVNKGKYREDRPSDHRPVGARLQCQ